MKKIFRVMIAAMLMAVMAVSLCRSSVIIELQLKLQTNLLTKFNF